MLSQVEIERLRLLANSFDRASTAMLTVGIFAPLAAAMYTRLPEAAPIAAYALGYVFWLAGAYIFHRLATRTLERLS